MPFIVRMHMESMSNIEGSCLVARVATVRGKHLKFFSRSKESQNVVTVAILDHWETNDSKGYMNQGPVVQSIVSLTSSLRGQLIKCFTTS